MTGIAGCCARAMSGHAAAPPINEMNSRRLIAPPKTQDQGIVPWQTSKLKGGECEDAKSP
jgi:hypothetical protein